MQTDLKIRFEVRAPKGVRYFLAKTLLAVVGRLLTFKFRMEQEARLSPDRRARLVAAYEDYAREQRRAEVAPNLAILNRDPVFARDYPAAAPPARCESCYHKPTGKMAEVRGRRLCGWCACAEPGEGR